MVANEGGRGFEAVRSAVGVEDFSVEGRPLELCGWEKKRDVRRHDDLRKNRMGREIEDCSLLGRWSLVCSLPRRSPQPQRL